MCSPVRRWVLLSAVLLLAPITRGAAQSTEVVSGADTISYASFGSGPATILLVHGWSNNGTFWEPHLFGLSRRYRVVTVDLASFGEATAHRSEWSMPAFASDLAAVLDDLEGTQVVVVGFSMGGAIAVELASLGREDVIGIVLVDILHDPDYAPADDEIAQRLQQSRENYRHPGSLRSAFSPGAPGSLVRRYISRTPEVAPEQWWASLRELFVWMRNDMRTTLRSVRVPIAAINSDREPTLVEAWQQYSPGFSAHVLGDVGHLGSIWEQVDEFDTVLISIVEDVRDQSRD
jgi:sigma-B regulation protein RsbQ